MKKLLIGFSLTILSFGAFAENIEPSYEEHETIVSVNYSRGSISQKVATYVDERRGTVCYITYGKISGSVPGTANEGNPAISCVKL